MTHDHDRRATLPHLSPSDVPGGWIDVPDPAGLLRTLLPAFYWLDDAAVAATTARDGDRAQGPLRALVDALATVFDELQSDVAGLYDDVFLETCRAALVPYVAETIGVDGIEGGYAQRRWVGRIVALRRRKGSLATLVRAAAAATDWSVYGRPGAQSAAYTAAVGDPGARVGGTVDVRSPDLISRLRSPWSDVRRGVGISGRAFGAQESVPPSRGGFERPLAPRVTALDVWRLQAFAVTGRIPAHVATWPDATRVFTFSPIGIDTPLFQVPVTNDDPLDAPGPAQLPLPVTRDAARRALARAARGDTPDDDDDGDMDATVPFGLYQLEGSLPVVISPLAIAIADLDRVHRWQESEHVVALVDPERGRFALRSDAPPVVSVDYAYGFSASMGGGPYTVDSQFTGVGEGVARLVVDSRSRAARPEDETYRTVDEALRRVEQLGRSARITIVDSVTYRPPAGERWHVRLVAGQTLNVCADVGAAPALVGALQVEGPFDAAVRVAGLLLDGPVEIDGPGVVSIEHTTITPASGPRLRLRASAPQMLASITDSIVGAIDAHDGEYAVHLDVRDGVVDGLGRDAVGSVERPVAIARLERVTVLGRATAHTLDVTCAILTGGASVPRPDDGIARFSWLPPGDHDPRRWQCQPETALRGLGGAERARARFTLRPAFTSLRFGRPGFAQLGADCPEAIAAGGPAGEEMGAFASLLTPYRRARLPAVIREFIPAGQAATVRFRT